MRIIVTDLKLNSQKLDFIRNEIRKGKHTTANNWHTRCKVGK